MLILKHIIKFSYLHVIPMTLYEDIMPFFDKFIHVCLWLKCEYIVFPLKYLDAQKFYNW